MKTKSLLRPRSLATVTAASWGLAAAALFATAPVQALTFNFTPIEGDTLTDDQAAAFQTAADAWSAVLTDPVTVNVSIGFNNNIPGLGATGVAQYHKAYSDFTSHLAQDATTAVDRQALSSLPDPTAFGNKDILFTRAQARALGNYPIGPNQVDGSIEFSSVYPFATHRNADGSVPAGMYDLVGVAEHEIGHLLGFISALDDSTTYRTALDLFRYGSPGTLSFQQQAAAYFSLDRGASQIALFSDGYQYQASHWADMLLYNGQRALMDPATPPGVADNITALDVVALDLMGWDATPASEAGFYVVPEPSTWALLGVGTAGLGLVLRRRRARLL